MKQCMEKTLILWLSKTISAATATAMATATAATATATAATTILAQAHSVRFIGPSGQALAILFIFVSNSNYQMLNPCTLPLPLCLPPPAACNDPNSMHVPLVFLAPYSPSGVGPRATPRHVEVASLSLCTFCLAFSSHSLSLTNFKCTWLFAPFNAPARMQFKRIKVNLAAFAGGFAFTSTFNQ